MDFLENLMKINNLITLQNMTKDRDLNEEETELFIQKYDKHPVKPQKISLKKGLTKTNPPTPKLKKASLSINLLILE